MAVIKKDGYGVYKVEEFWWFRTYRSDDAARGPFETRSRAMEDLLAHIGFDVADDGPAVSSPARGDAT